MNIILKIYTSEDTKCENGDLHQYICNSTCSHKNSLSRFDSTMTQNVFYSNVVCSPRCNEMIFIPPQVKFIYHSMTTLLRGLLLVFTIIYYLLHVNDYNNEDLQ